MSVYYYIFSKTYGLYTTWGDKHPGVYALGVVTLLQFLTVGGLSMLPQRLNYEKAAFNGVVVTLIVALVFALNYVVFYVLNKPEKIIEKMKNLSQRKDKMLGILAVAHLVITISLVVLLSNLPVVE